MISFQRVSKRYPEGLDALREVSLEIGQEELVFLTGHSGAGKSTLLRLIMLIERPTRGQVTVDGRELGRIRRGGIPAYRRDIGVVFQNHQLLGDRTVYDNVALPLVIAGYDERDVGRRVRAALDKVGLLQRERAMPQVLSGGEQQRVGIARAVVARPKILLADEPTGTWTRAVRRNHAAVRGIQPGRRHGTHCQPRSVTDLPLHHRILTLREGNWSAEAPARGAPGQRGRQPQPHPVAGPFNGWWHHTGSPPPTACPGCWPSRCPAC